MMQYSFKRAFYYDVEKAISDSSVTFLLGPRRCGKTVCLRQLEETFSSNGAFDEVIYVDVRRDFATALEKSLFIGDMKKAIAGNERKLFLVDEVTYLHQPDGAMVDIEDAFTMLHNTNTKVVLTGSQSRALECWGHRAFAGDALFIRTDFLSYPEWLAFKGITEVSEKTYEQFIRGTREFYPNFHGTKEYLQGCLDETVISNNKSIEFVLNNECDRIDTNKLLDVLYASLQASISEIDSLISERYRNYQKMDSYELRQALQFLSNCGLITITYVSDSFDTKPYIVQELLNDLRDLPKREVFSSLNICIKYPMFYVDILQSLLKDIFPERLPRILLGSIVENHVRAVLPSTGCFEYHDEQDREIDYVSNSSQKAVEVSISNKNISSTHFDLLPSGYEKILLTKDIDDIKGDVRCIPYYRFIFEHSVGQELVR